MAHRQLAKREVTDVTMPESSDAKSFAALAETAEGFMELEKKKDLANMNDFMADANLQMLDVTNKWRIANEGDPINQEALGKLHAEYERILSQYNDKIGLLSRGDWTKVSSRLKSQYQLDNLQWGQKQAIVNMENSVNSGIKKNLLIAADYGRMGDLNKLKNHYQDTRENIVSFSKGIIGQEGQKKLLENYESDSMFSFLLGMAENNPKGALELLDKEEIRLSLGSEKKYIKAKNMIAGRDKAQKRQIESEKVQNRFDILTNVYEGKFNWQDTFETINKIGSTDQELAEALTNNLERYEPEEDASGEIKNKAFMTLAENIFNSKDPKTISDFLVNTLSDNKNISRDRLAILVYAAKEHVGEVKKADGGSGFWESVFNFISQFNSPGPQIKSYQPPNTSLALFNTIKRAKAENVQGEQVLNIAKDEIEKEFKKINPKYTIENIGYTAAESGMTIPQLLEALRAKEGRK